jgi:hypothetical protein
MPCQCDCATECGRETVGELRSGRRRMGRFTNDVMPPQFIFNRYLTKQEYNDIVLP